MTIVQRFDRARIRATKTDEGFLCDSAILTRCGIFEYARADGTIRREYRPADEVFHVDHLASLRGKPVTNGHPSESVTSKNARSLAVGSILTEGRRDGDSLVADLIVYDTSAIDSGDRELSLGYAVEMDETPGEIDGQRFDAIQRRMRVNHAAIVSKGRAGTAKLNLDSAELVASTEPAAGTAPAASSAGTQPAPATEARPVADKQVARVRTDAGIEYEAPPEVAAEINRLRADLTTARADADKAAARADAADAKVKAAQDETAKVRTDAVAHARARLTLEAAAAEHKVSFKADATDRAIREGVIRAIRGDSAGDLSAKSDGYIEAAYDLATADAAARKDAAGKQTAEVNGATAKADSADTKTETKADAAQGVQTAFNSMINRYKTAGAAAKA